MTDNQAPERPTLPGVADATTDEVKLEPDFAEAPGVAHCHARIFKRLTDILRFNDFMTVMMVVATAFSAFATWRTAQVTNLLFTVAERPYVGVQRATIEAIDANFARLVVDCRNYGRVSANDGVIQISVMIDGRHLPGTKAVSETENVGIVSPTVPHPIFRYVPKVLYEQVRAGQSHMVVQVLFNYRGPDNRHFCYSKLLSYDRRSGDFIPSGGTDQCGSEIY